MDGVWTSPQVEDSDALRGLPWVGLLIRRFRVRIPRGALQRRESPGQKLFLQYHAPPPQPAVRAACASARRLAQQPSSTQRSSPAEHLGRRATRVPQRQCGLAAKPNNLQVTTLPNSALEQTETSTTKYEKGAPQLIDRRQTDALSRQLHRQDNEQDDRARKECEEMRRMTGSCTLTSAH